MVKYNMNPPQCAASREEVFVRGEGLDVEIKCRPGINFHESGTVRALVEYQEADIGSN